MNLRCTMCGLVIHIIYGIIITPKIINMSVTSPFPPFIEPLVITFPIS